MDTTVIAYAKRTPIGKLSGAFKDTPAPMLGATLVRDATDQLAIPPDQIDEIIMGNVLTAGVGQAPARQAAIRGGLPNSVCATTINRVCGSGLKSVMLADQAIRLGETKLILAGGQENMTMAPHMLCGSRAGFRFGAVEAKDHMQWDGLWDPYNDMAMGHCGEICAKEYGFSRQAQDEFSIESYRRARSAIESQTFANELVPVTIKQRKSEMTIDKDEEPFGVDLERVPGLRPAFSKDGTITAANASSINDGAALLVMTSESHAKASGWEPIARVVAQASHAQDPQWFTTAPIACIKKVLAKSKLKTTDIDLYEINEAFAVVAMAAMKDLELSHEQVNVHGGAVSLGHPIGASGARILVTLLNALDTYKKKRGLAAICIGGGEASAVVVERF